MSGRAVGKGEAIGRACACAGDGRRAGADEDKGM